MLAHRRHQHLLRQGHEPRVDPTEQHDRPFDQPSKLREETRIVPQDEAFRTRELDGSAGDLVLPIGAVELHVGGGKLLPIVLEVAHLDRRRGEKAMPDRDCAAA